MHRRLWLALAALGLIFSETAVVAPTASNRLPLDVFATLPFLTSPKLSPDGKLLLAQFEIEERAGLAVFEVFNESKSDPQLLNAKDLEILDFHWAGNDRIVIAVGQKISVRGEDYYVTRMISTDRTLGAVQKLNWSDNASFDGSSVVFWPHGEQNYIYLESRRSWYYHDWFPSVVRVDLTTGRTKTIERPWEPIHTWLADTAGVVRFGWSYSDSSGVQTLHYRNKDGEVYRTIHRANLAKGEHSLRPVALQANSSRFLLRHLRDRRSALSTWDLESDQFIQNWWSHPRYDLGSVMLDTDGFTPIGITYMAESRETVWFDERLKEIQRALQESVAPAKTARIISFDRTRSLLLVWVGRPEEPGAYYIYHPAWPAMKPLGNVRDKFPSKSVAPVKMVRYQTEDGLEIEAVLTLPRDLPAKDLPVVIMPHGGPASRDVIEFDYWTQFLANRGYAVLQPNFRGSDGYGDEFQDKANGVWGTAVQDDIIAGLDWLVEQGAVDAKRACIMGGSFGGYSAMASIVRAPKKFRCSIAIAGISDLKEMLRYDRRFLYSKAWEHHITANDADIIAMSPLNHVPKIETPLLLIHGARDVRVPVRQSKLMAERMTRAGKEHELLILPTADHHFTREIDRAALLTSIERFLNRYNPATLIPN
jgi:dipeptidyl aminopeptidase/acylaminoacyl peptidase